jgi:hypothetical protein
VDFAPAPTDTSGKSSLSGNLKGTADNRTMHKLLDGRLSFIFYLGLCLIALPVRAQVVDNRGSTGLEGPEFHKPALGQTVGRPSLPRLPYAAGCRTGSHVKILNLAYRAVCWRRHGRHCDLREWSRRIHGAARQAARDREDERRVAEGSGIIPGERRTVTRADAVIAQALQAR